MGSIYLRQAIGILAKSSSVKTTPDRLRDTCDDLKEYLYVKPDTEFDFEKSLGAMQLGDCVFLCGSNGDRKSNILFRYYERYKNRYTCHLDVTHSFPPHQLVIEALDDPFDRVGQWRLPLAVGINTGMLANFTKDESLYIAFGLRIIYEIFELLPDEVSSLYSQAQKLGKLQVERNYRQITKTILNDDVDNFMSQYFPSLRKILKEGHEYGVGGILSTQELSHFKTGENNCGSYILTWVEHRVAEIKNADIKAIFNKDDKTEQEQLMETIRKLDKHFSLYIDGDKKVSMMRDRFFF